MSRTLPRAYVTAAWSKNRFEAEEEARKYCQVLADNKNVLIVGGSGSGKTRFWLKPNLLQMHSSYVVTDPKGSIACECGNALLKNGYRIKIFNTINFKKSMHYNPFAYIHSEKDILKLVTTLIANTKGESKGGDDFWLKAETLLYTALIGYIHYEAPEEEQNFSTLLEMINAMEVREDDEEFKNPVDLMFEALEKENPDHFAVRQYAKYKLAAGKTAKSILVSCGARLAPFDIKELRDITAYDELELDTLGDKKTALFLIMSDTDATFNFLISMIYSQLFNLLCEKADDVYGGRLPVHVRCLIDECANIGQIPNLEKLVATIRSREISACLVLQAKSQLKAIYKDNHRTNVDITNRLYEVLLMRYKELKRGGGGGHEEVGYDIDSYLMSLPTDKIDADYMNSRFQKYYKLVKEEADEETKNAMLNELHKSFASLSQEEQKYAHMVIHDIQNSTLEYDESKSITDYIAAYKAKAKNDEIALVASYIGLKESSLREFMTYHVTINNIDEFGRFEKLKVDIDINVAHKYFEEKEGMAIPRRKIHPMIDRFLRKFILEGIIE